MTPESENPPESIDAKDYYTVMIHFYRGELGRIMIWRQRLDITTNWAIVGSVGFGRRSPQSLALPCTGGPGPIHSPRARVERVIPVPPGLGLRCSVAVPDRPINTYETAIFGGRIAREVRRDLPALVVAP